MYNRNQEVMAETAGPGGLLRRETLRQRLESRQKDAKEHLDDVTRALKFLDDNPNFEAFHDLLGKAGF